jgi:hypothetical protein
MLLAGSLVTMWLLAGCRTNDPPGKLDTHDVAGQ